MKLLGVYLAFLEILDDQTLGFKWIKVAMKYLMMLEDGYKSQTRIKIMLESQFEIDCVGILLIWSFRLIELWEFF